MGPDRVLFATTLERACPSLAIARHLARTREDVRHVAAYADSHPVRTAFGRPRLTASAHSRQLPFEPIWWTNRERHRDRDAAVRSPIRPTTTAISCRTRSRDHRFDTQIWLAGDHYKWRAMRAAVDERYLHWRCLRSRQAEMGGNFASPGQSSLPLDTPEYKVRDDRLLGPGNRARHLGGGRHLPRMPEWMNVMPHGRHKTNTNHGLLSLLAC